MLFEVEYTRNEVNKDNFYFQDNLIHHNFTDSSRPAVKANPVGLAINTHGKISHAFRNGTFAASTPSSTLGGLPDVVPRTPQATPTESFRISTFFHK